MKHLLTYLRIIFAMLTVFLMIPIVYLVRKLTEKGDTYGKL